MVEEAVWISLALLAAFLAGVLFAISSMRRAAKSDLSTGDVPAPEDGVAILKAALREYGLPSTILPDPCAREIVAICWRLAGFLSSRGTINRGSAFKQAIDEVPPRVAAILSGQDKRTNKDWRQGAFRSTLEKHGLVEPSSP